MLQLVTVFNKLLLDPLSRSINDSKMRPSRRKIVLSSPLRDDDTPDSPLRFETDPLDKPLDYQPTNDVTDPFYEPLERQPADDLAALEGPLIEEEEEDLEVNGKSTSVNVQTTSVRLGLQTDCTTFKGLLLSSIDNSAMKQCFLQFISQDTSPYDTSLVPLDAFVDRVNPQDWDTHCFSSRERFHEFCSELDHLADSKIHLPSLAAPSGPERSRLTILWNYPTTTSLNSTFGHVMDPGNPCLRAQKVRFRFKS